MKRTPLARRSALRASKPPKPRRPLKKRGARSARVAEALAASRAVALERAKGRCEACGARGPLDVHHAVPRARGVGWPGLHTPRNLVALCRADHDRVTLDPLAIVEAPGELGTRAAIVWKEFQAWRAGDRPIPKPKKERTP